jgi:hypothetical protein
MLARYAADFAVFREVVQNADDATASEFELHLRFKSDGSVVSFEAKNNGRIFTDEDWQRVAKIAEGNPDESTVGMFGVGFYSVFSFSEQPLIKSGDRCLLFHWNGDQLATSAGSVPYSSWTSILMEFREPMFWNLFDISVFFQQTMCFTKTVMSLKVISHLPDSPPVNIFHIQKKLATPVELKQGHPLKTNFLTISSISVFNMHLEVQSRVIAQQQPSQEKSLGTSVIDCLQFTGPEVPPTCEIISLQLACAEAKVGLSRDFAERAFRVMKKHLPPVTTLKLLFDDHRGIGEPMAHRVGTLSKLCPSGLGGGLSAISDHDAGAQGRVFVGLATHQTTGSGYHMHAQLIPTVERENIGTLNQLSKLWCVLWDGFSSFYLVTLAASICIL